MKTESILIIPETSKFGGANTYLLQLLGYYLKFPNLRIYLGIEKNQINSYITELTHENKIEVIRIKSRPNNFHNLLRKFPFSIIFDLFVLLPLTKKIKPKLIFFSIINPGLFLGSFLLKVKIIYLIHSDITGSSKYPFKIKTYLKLVLNENKRIVLVSEYLKRNLIKHWIDDKKINLAMTIYNKSSFITEDFINAKTRYSNNITILTVGHFEWHKNPSLWLKVALEVLRSNRNIRIKFLWIGDGSLIANIISQIPPEFADSIIIKGYIKDLKPYYQSSDIYFLPSLRETLGISVIDAMSFKIPCVVSNTGGLSELVINGYNGFIIDNNDIKYYILGLNTLIEDKDKRILFGENGYSRYLKFFSPQAWEFNMDQLHRMILEIPNKSS